MSIQVESEDVKHLDDFIESTYLHKYSRFDPDSKKVKIENTVYNFRTQKEHGKVGLLMVGLGGNNGSTILGGILANKNKVTWNTKKGLQTSNMLGSMTQSATMKIA